MKTNTFIVKLYSAIFIIFSLPAFFVPESFASILHYDITLSAAKMEFVAAYGGLILGFGIYLWICANQHSRLGLLAILCVIGSLLAGRFVGFVLDDGTTWIQNSFLAIEFLSVVLILHRLNKERVNMDNRVGISAI